MAPDIPDRPRAHNRMKNRNSASFVYFAPPRRCWGRLQSRVLFALIDGHGQARTREIASVCWDDPPTPRQFYSQGRACKAIGAVRVRREGREWVWRLSNKDYCRINDYFFGSFFAAPEISQ